MIRTLRCLIAATLLLPAHSVFCQEKPWMLAPFIKQDEANPILTPGKLKFTDPILDKPVAWEEKYVFNPAAVVRNGKVYLLYRAEYTVQKLAGVSRVGLAESYDGIHFTRRHEPVLYPHNDQF